jgi:hypothetical protein
MWDAAQQQPLDLATHSNVRHKGSSLHLAFGQQCNSERPWLWHSGSGTLGNWHSGNCTLASGRRHQKTMLTPSGNLDPVCSFSLPSEHINVVVVDMLSTAKIWLDMPRIVNLQLGIEQALTCAHPTR